MNVHDRCFVHVGGLEEKRYEVVTVRPRLRNREDDGRCVMHVISETESSHGSKRLEKKFLAK